uniref:Cholinergic receptor nicotinic gamma subunit n=1 Tax=Astyanax mexicanus TaxID=7994 RepID=A0A8B9HUS1_ASTMX
MFGGGGACCHCSASGNEESKLIADKFKNYNKNIRPARHTEDKVQVQVKLTLTNLISLNEKEETLTTNVWIEIQWNDYRLAWNTSDYHDISLIRVPYNTVWLPDIVLENNIDGKFDVAYYANVLIYSDGSMYWLPPAIYRSTCAIEITYFPFDWQNCTLVFRSQTYSANEIDMILAIDADTQKPIEWVDIDPEAFTENGEWAIKHRPARKLTNTRYSPDDLEYQEVYFNLIIQRKPLFYIINIILPCALISSLVVLAYFLPAQAGGQKLTVSISVLLAQTVFLILVSQKVPETSLSVPLIGKYLIFVMSVTTLIVTNCIVVLNFSLRSPSTHTMSRTLKHVCLSVTTLHVLCICVLMCVCVCVCVCVCLPLVDTIDVSSTATLYKSLAQAAPEIKECVDACNFIAESTRQQNDIGSEMESWVLIGKMVDKVCFWAAILLFSIGTVAIFLMGHFNQVPDLGLHRIINEDLNSLQPDAGMPNVM